MAGSDLRLRWFSPHPSSAHVRWLPTIRSNGGFPRVEAYGGACEPVGIPIRPLYPSCTLASYEELPGSAREGRRREDSEHRRRIARRHGVPYKEGVSLIEDAAPEWQRYPKVQVDRTIRLPDRAPGTISIRRRKAQLFPMPLKATRDDEVAWLRTIKAKAAVVPKPS